MQGEIRVFTKCKCTKTGKSVLSKVIVFGSGNQVQIPIQPNGEIKWFDDSKLLKK